MRVVIIDDEALAVKRLEKLLKNYSDVQVIACFTDAIKGIDFIKKNLPDLIFIDIEMPEISGVEVVERLNELESKMRFVFTTAHENYALKAFELGASDYLLKPFRAMRLEESLKKLKGRNPHWGHNENQATMKIQFFGSFKVRILKSDEEYVMEWRTSKMKELMAYLALNANREILRDKLIELFWQDFDMKKAYNNLSTVLYYLKRELKKQGFVDSIQSNKRTIRFILDHAKMQMDIENFQKIQADNTTVEDLKKSIISYEGDFLEEEDYLWSENFRFHYKKLLGVAVQQLMKEESQIEWLDSQWPSLIGNLNQEENLVNEILGYLKESRQEEILNKYMSFLEKKEI